MLFVSLLRWGLGGARTRAQVVNLAPTVATIAVAYTIRSTYAAVKVGLDKSARAREHPRDWIESSRALTSTVALSLPFSP